MKWISTKYKLPKNKDYDILCNVKFKDGYKTLSDYGTVYDDKNITHWAEVQKTPKGF